MIRKTKFNRFLSLLLAISMMVGAFPISTFASEQSNNINLSLKDVNENQNVFSKAYMYNNEIKYIYAYNTASGTCRLTGDIPYSGGTFGNDVVRHEEGYIELPFLLTDLDVVTLTTEDSKQGCALFLLTKNNELKNFTYVTDGWDIQGMDVEAPKKISSYEAYTICENVVKLEKNFYLDSEGVLRIFGGNQIYKVEKELEDFVFLGNNTIRLYYKDGHTSFAKVSDFWGGFIDNTPTNIDELISTGHPSSLDGSRYLSYKYSGNDLVVSSSEDYFQIDNLVAIKDNESFSLTKDNATSVSGNTYTYSLFDGNVTFIVNINNKDYVTMFKVVTSDGQKAMVKGIGVDTTFGTIQFRIPTSGYTYGSISLNKDEENSFKNSLRGVISKSFNSQYTSKDWNQHTFYGYNGSYGNNGWYNSYWYDVSFKKLGHIYEMSYKFEEGTIDIYIDFKNRIAKIGHREENVTYDVSEDFCFDGNDMRYIIASYFDFVEKYEYSYIFPTLYYYEEQDYILIKQEANDNSLIHFNLDYTYFTSENNLENLEEDSDSYYWHLYNLYVSLSTSQGYLNRNASFARDISYLLNKVYGIEVESSDLIIAHGSQEFPMLGEIGRDVVTIELYKHLVRSFSEEESQRVKEAFLACWDDENKEYHRSTTMDSYVIQYNDWDRVDIVNDFIGYILETNSTFNMNNIKYTYKNEYYDYDTYKYKYVESDISYDGYKGYNLSSTTLILEEQAPYYMTVSPYECNSFIISDTTLLNKGYYALNKQGTLYKTLFSEELNENIYDNLTFTDRDTVVTELKQDVIAENVVKVISTGHYLTSNGNLYKEDGTLVKSGVTNIVDNLYQHNGSWYYLDTGLTFNFNYATDLNLRPQIISSSETSIVYKFLFNKDIVSVKTPKGTTLKDGDTYTITSNGCYIFEVTNSYGDIFEETIIVNHLGIAGLVGISPMVVDGILTLQCQKGGIVEYSFDNNTWIPYIEAIDMAGKNEIYFRGQHKGVSLGSYRLTLNEESEVTIYNLSPAGLSPDNFFGIGYLKDGAYYNQYNEIQLDNVTDISIFDEYNAVYIDDSGKLMVLTDTYSFEYRQCDFMPVYRSPKIDFESGIENPVDIYSDGYYTYILGDSGNLAAVQLGDIFWQEEISTYNYMFYSQWNEYWLSNGVEDLNHGNAYLSDGTVLPLNSYGITKEEIERALASTTFLDEEGNEIDRNSILVTTTEIVGDYLYILSSNLEVYNTYIHFDENGVLVLEEAEYIYTIDLDAQNIDFTIEETIWVNNDFSIKANLPESYNIFKLDFDALYSEKYTPISDAITLLNLPTSNLRSEKWLADYNYDGPTLYIKTGDTPISLSCLYESNESSANRALYVYDEDLNYVDYTTEIVSNDGTYSEWETYEYFNQNIAGLYKQTYELEPNSYYKIELSRNYFITDDNKNIFLVNDQFSDMSEYLDVAQYVEVVSSFNTTPEVTMLDESNFTFVPDSNGLYEVKLVDGMGRTISKGFVRLGNLDTYEPELTEIQIVNGQIVPVFEDYLDKSGKTSQSGVWTLEYSEDDGVTWQEFEGGIIYQPSTTYNLRRSTIVTSPNILVRATDKAGNVSEPYAIDLDMEIFESYIYENGKTTVKFYADDDNDWSNPKMEYSYDLGVGSSNGHEFSVVVDTDALLGAVHNKDIPSSVQKNVFVEVVNVDKTITSLVEDMLNVKVGDYENADFSKLYVNIDRKGYQEYSTEEMQEKLGVGTHIIESYFEVVKDGQIIKSLESLEVVTIEEEPDLNTTTIHPTINYENGKTTLEFYANEDETNSEFEYSYIIDGVEEEGHQLEVTEDTIVELVAKKIGYEDGKKTIALVVISTNAPTISNLINNKDVVVTKGDIENATLDKIVVTIDDTTHEIYSAEKVFELLEEGTHNIKAYQVVKTIIDGEVVTITSDEVETSVNVVGTIRLHPTFTYENGKTIVSFYADSDTNHDQGYTYSYVIDGVTQSGYTFELTEDKEVVIKAEKVGKISSEATLNVKVIKVEKPTITQSDKNAIVVVGSMKNTSLDKLYVQYNNGEIQIFDTFATNIPLNIGENIVKAYTSTKTTINGQIVTMLSDVTEKTFTLEDETIKTHTIVVKDHFGDNVQVRVEETLKAGDSYSFESLNVNGWKVVGNSKYEGVISGDLVIEFEYEQEVIPPEPDPISPKEDDPIIEPPKTGDTTNLIIPIVFMFVGLFGVIISLMSKKQTKCD